MGSRPKSHQGSLREVSRLKDHLKTGIVLCCLFSLIQAFLEWIFVGVIFQGHIFRSQDLLEFQLFGFIHRSFPSSQEILFPYTDRSYGPDLFHKAGLLPLLCMTYGIVGLLSGITLSLLFWLILKVCNRSSMEVSLSSLYLSFLLALLLVGNVLIWLNIRDLIKTFTLSGLLINLSLILNGILLLPFFYRSLSKLFIRSRSSMPVVFKRALYFLPFILILGAFPAALKLSRAEAVVRPFEDYPSMSLKANKDFNVVLISIDSLRADHLSCYGYRQKTSPNIDKLAEGSTLFKDAFSVSSWTLPAHASLLTSLYPEVIRVTHHDDSLADSRTTLSEILKNNGWVTGGFISGPFLNSPYGFAQGFDYYDDFTVHFKNLKEGNVAKATSPRLNNAVIDWVMKNHSNRFFLFVHYWDVHYDYDPPPPYDRIFDPDYTGTIDARFLQANPRIHKGMDKRDLQHVISLYDGEIAFTDHYIGELLDQMKQMGIYEKSLIIVTSDHGDEFFEHGGIAHRRTLYDEVLRVPLIIKLPKNLGDSARQVEGMVSLVDVMPTILDLAGINYSGKMQGRSIVPFLLEKGPPEDREIFASLWIISSAVRSRSSKFIENFLPERKTEFYLLEKDPKERLNLLKSSSQQIQFSAHNQQMILLDWLNRNSAFSRSMGFSTEEKIVLDESLNEQLRSLGYIQ